MDKSYENLCEISKNQSYFADSLFLKELFDLNERWLNNLINIFKKSAFSKRNSFSFGLFYSIFRVILIYTWDTFLGHPVC